MNAIIYETRMTHAARIAYEVAVMKLETSASQVHPSVWLAINAAACALADVESDGDFEWINQDRTWEEVCRILAQDIANGRQDFHAEYIHRLLSF